jgi:hypothetical protein
VKLYARTPSGTGLGLDVLLTGQIKESDGKVRSVEVMLPIGCDHVVGYAVEPLPKSPGGRHLLWADPADVCANNGDTVSHDDLRAEAARIRKQDDDDRFRGPLGENWP